MRRLAGIDFPGTDPELTGYQAVVDIADPEKLADGWVWSSEAERRPAGAWVLDWTRAQIAVLRGDAGSAALRGIVADLLSTRDGTTHMVKMISGGLTPVRGGPGRRGTGSPHPTGFMLVAE